jgi:hypothetical protein
MIAYLLFVTLMSGDEYQIQTYPTFEDCDVAAEKIILEKNPEIFSVRCILDEKD